jgi:inhibitor of cysteine peptidase
MGIFDGIENINEEGTENAIRARLNQSFSIVLASLPTAGYSWMVDFDSLFLNLESDRFQIAQPQAIGSGGQQIFAFTPIRTGSTKVTAIYKRPWENRAEVERVFLVEISE